MSEKQPIKYKGKVTLEDREYDFRIEQGEHDFNNHRIYVYVGNT